MNVKNHVCSKALISCLILHNHSFLPCTIGEELVADSPVWLSRLVCPYQLTQPNHFGTSQFCYKESSKRLPPPGRSWWNHQYFSEHSLRKANWHFSKKLKSFKAPNTIIEKFSLLRIFRLVRRSKISQQEGSQETWG